MNCLYKQKEDRLMTRKMLFNLLLVLFIALPVSAMAAGKTAMGALPNAEAEAKAWQPDAALVNITTDSATPDGTGVWAYTFLSPKTKEKITVMVDADGKASRFDSYYYKNDLIGDFTIDSDEAMAEAVKNGLKTSDFGMSMDLEENEGQAEWRMLDDKNFYYIDAKSGKLLRKEKTD
jgi:uncharacterized protein YpmB